jgi:hypothetical protein
MSETRKNPNQPNANDAGKVSATVSAMLAMRGYAAATAASIALLYSQAFTYLQHHPDVSTTIGETKDLVGHVKTGFESVKASKQLATVSKLLENQSRMNGLGGTVVRQALKERRAIHTGASLGVMVDFLVTYAERNNVPLDRCAISFVKSDLDLLGFVGGGLEGVAAKTFLQAGVVVWNLNDLREDLQKTRDNCSSELGLK